MTKTLLPLLASAAGHLLAWLARYGPGLLAVLLVAAGAWWIYPPAGLITAGALLLADRVTDRPPKGGERT